MSRGFKVYLLSGTVATPLVAFGVSHLKACAGVMVTASHNPKMDNGYKVPKQECSFFSESPEDACCFVIWIGALMFSLCLPLPRERTPVFTQLKKLFWQLVATPVVRRRRGRRAVIKIPCPSSSLSRLVCEACVLILGRTIMGVFRRICRVCLQSIKSTASTPLYRLNFFEAHPCCIGKSRACYVRRHKRHHAVEHLMR